MAVPNSSSTFKEHCLRRLGKPVIEINVDDDQLDAVIEAISKSANTQKIGDGKIFVYELNQVVRIRTGETGSSAI